MRILLSLVAALVQITFASTVVQAATIFDTTGAPIQEVSYSGAMGGAIAGGTFNSASLSVLSSFSLYLGIEGGVQANGLKAIVLATDASGVPTGTPLWESAEFAAIGARTDYSFSPNVQLNGGEMYFIGVDTGVLTTAYGGDFTIQAAGSTGGILSGAFWEYSELMGEWFEGTGYDVRTTTTLTSLVPEPGTATLMGLGLGLLAWSRKSNAKINRTSTH